ncbi:hypothetical protein GALMADRAFT_102704 [Galerina marginata CBS 339.88]|uniref:Hydrophobin n=1 Tax=Galerina marginata (strain CBS 339.88) TaxID=685588 RepID=A0A067SX03_GALM3|nr:hypothetical protein GALMADRAFT_102704 [Galerina marginata CBS 339.88]
MKFALTSSTVAVVLSIPLMAVAQQCRPMCCDAVVQSVLPPGKVGINCQVGGIDCPFSGQVRACCATVVPLGGIRGTGVLCQ